MATNKDQPDWTWNDDEGAIQRRERLNQRMEDTFDDGTSTNEERLTIMVAFLVEAITDLTIIMATMADVIDLKPGKPRN